MNKKIKICVLIRVYNRIDDLKYCLEIIRSTWHLFDYTILVVANGKSHGFEVDEKIKSIADIFIDLEVNTGHFTGNSQLLNEGLPYIPEDCQYTIILEADTWLYGDKLVKKYVEKLHHNNAVWASAQFFRYIPNLATDFAIIKSAYIRQYPEIFTFEKTPEYFVAKFLKERRSKYLYISELMPINMPRYIKSFPFAPSGRFFSFPKGKMVTHHIEQLKGGMDEKKYYFNVVADYPYFSILQKKYQYTRLEMRFWMLVSFLLPYKSWFIKQKNDDSI